MSLWADRKEEERERRERKEGGKGGSQDEWTGEGLQASLSTVTQTQQ